LIGVFKPRYKQYELVICEKPLAAKRISEVLGSKKLVRRELAPGVIVFEIISKKNQRFIICSALGHLYSLVPIEKNRKKYPIYEVKWSPRYSSSVKERKRIIQTLKVISNISQNASGFIHACDYDLEGELIGYNILQLACNDKYKISKRAKFSALTDAEINQSFSNLQKTNVRNANAGKARHLIDFIFGINLSRALVNCLNVTSLDYKYHNLSIGRVQGPTLGFITEREIKINGHVPDPVWYVIGKFKKDGTFFKANLMSIIRRSSEAEKILNLCKNQTGVVKRIVCQNKKIYPPTPFNTSNLQKEAYRIFKMSPSKTLLVAESLYLAALISYPRTSSQKLPPSIGYLELLERLKLNYFNKNEQTVNDLLERQNLDPCQGKEEDPAHPAIYPTGIKGKKLNLDQQRILDLIIKRFLSTFGNCAEIKYVEVTMDVKGHYFITKGSTILGRGWLPIHEPYFSINESNIPEFAMGEAVKLSEIKTLEDFTRPPTRYNQASILNKMESEGIGTKSTRADIINLLINREYIVQDTSGIQPSELGFTVLDTMKKFAPEIVSTKLTNLLESNIKKIQEGEIEIKNVRKYLEKVLKNPINNLRANEWLIGHEIKNVLTNFEYKMSFGKCPKCQKGEMILTKSSKSKKRFIACSQYRITGCKVISPVPQRGLIRMNSTCRCGWPVLSIILPGKNLWKNCVNTVCSKNMHNRTNSNYDLVSNTSI